jgi:hypothetical protein
MSAGGMETVGEAAFDMATLELLAEAIRPPGDMVRQKGVGKAPVWNASLE